MKSEKSDVNISDLSHLRMYLARFSDLCDYFEEYSGFMIEALRIKNIKLRDENIALKKEITKLKRRIKR